MSTKPYLGMRPGDLDDRPYAKHWNPDMEPMQHHVQQALMQGIEAAELGFPVAETNQLLEPGYLPLESGYTRLSNGQIFVATLTKMAGVSGKMIDWWFGWHYMESQRYKLWHPRAHLANRAQRMIGDDSGLSDRDKYLANPNYVTEYIGAAVQKLVITFADPSTYFDVSCFDDANVSTAICGTVGLQNSRVNTGILVHLIRETDDGCEMRSRFWLGQIEFKGRSPDGILNRAASSRLVARQVVPLELGRNMVVHCAMEMNHLAGFLADLYADYHSR